jgi:hypothetical protein
MAHKPTEHGMGDSAVFLANCRSQTSCSISPSSRDLVGAGHTIGTVQRPKHLDPTGRFFGLILLKPRTFPEEAEKITAEDGREIRYLAIIPVLKDELALKLECGADALEATLTAAGVTELLNPDRESTISGQYT